MIIPRNMSERWLAAGSSPVDWCEDNYTVSTHVAEFTNTISNVLLIVLPLIAMGSGVWRSYTKYVSNGPVIMLNLYGIVGLGSCYFHGTLSLLGQFIDEVSLLWLIIMGYIFLFPPTVIDKIIPSHLLTLFYIIYGFFMTYMWISNTNIYAFWLIILPIPGVFATAKRLTSNKYIEAKYYLRFSMVGYVVCMSLWFIDQFLCGYIKYVGLPGVHNLFHLTIAYSSFVVLSVLAYWKAVDEAPHLTVTIKHLFWGFPYIHCEKKINLHIRPHQGLTLLDLFLCLFCLNIVQITGCPKLLLSLQYYI